MYTHDGYSMEIVIESEAKNHKWELTVRNRLEANLRFSVRLMFCLALSAYMTNLGIHLQRTLSLAFCCLLPSLVSLVLFPQIGLRF